MAFIKVPLNYSALARIRKYAQLAGKLDPMAALPIHAAILAAEESPQTGRLAITSEALERKLGWHGAPGRGVDAMIKAGILGEVDGGYDFLGWERPWDDEQGHIAKFKERAKRAAFILWHGPPVDAASITTSNANSIRGE